MLFTVNIKEVLLVHLFDEDYILNAQQAFQYNPIVYLESILGSQPVVPASDLLQILISLKKSWNRCQRRNIQCGIIINNQSTGYLYGTIINYNFISDIHKAIIDGKKFIIYHIDVEGKIFDILFSDVPITHDFIVRESLSKSTVACFMGIKGIDTYINGVPFEIENHLDSYKDFVKYKKLLGIEKYKDLLNEFYLQYVQYDPLKIIFLYSGDCPADWRQLIDKYPKLLKNKPEERFQNLLIRFLKDNCKDQVLTEVRTLLKERYDVWVATDDLRIYIFELKWMGMSVTTGGNVFNEYNTAERALNGAYQLKDYIDNSERYSQLLGGEHEIYCGVLVMFDAREIMDDLDFPIEFRAYPQIDLFQHFKIEKDKISASQIHSASKKFKRTLQVRKK